MLIYIRRLRMKRVKIDHYTGTNFRAIRADQQVSSSKKDSKDSKDFITGQGSKELKERSALDDAQLASLMEVGRPSVQKVTRSIREQGPSNGDAWKQAFCEALGNLSPKELQQYHECAISLAERESNNWQSPTSGPR